MLLQWELCVLTSRLALAVLYHLSEHMWAAESQSLYLLFECETAHISQEEKTSQLSMAVPVVTYRLHDCWRILTGAEDIHRLCLGCVQNILLLWNLLAQVQVQPVLCCVICLSVHSNSTFMVRFDSPKLVSELHIQTRRTRGCCVEI